jgi:predicted Zn-dependent protease
MLLRAQRKPLSCYQHTLDLGSKPQGCLLTVGRDKVFIFPGILPLCKDEDGIVAELVHEIAHVVAHHQA